VWRGSISPPGADKRAATHALIGFGASAVGRLQQGFVQNASGAGAYGRATAAGAFATARGIALSAEDRVRGHVIERFKSCVLSVVLPRFVIG
jgi:coproporphyrinogen III oxidase-like Fe-S oxidoreductase